MRRLLTRVNSPTTDLMTLAAFQEFARSSQPEFSSALISFVTLCFADLPRNRRATVEGLAERVEREMPQSLQQFSNAFDRILFLDVVLELQPTRYQLKGIEGWSLTVLLAAYGGDDGEARRTWTCGLMALERALCGVGSGPSQADSPFTG